MSTFHLEILTPYGHYFNGEVEYLEVRNNDAVLGILKNHTPIISTIKLGRIRIKIKGKFKVYATTGGILNVKEDGTVTLMLNTIEKSDEIDLSRAKASLARARDRIEHNDGDIARARAAEQRAINRIEIAESGDDDKWFI